MYVVLRFSTENVRCLRKNWPSDPTNLGSLWGGVQHVYMTSWTLLGPERWSEATKKLHLDWRENMVSLPFKVPSQNELFCLVQSQTIYFYFSSIILEVNQCITMFVIFFQIDPYHFNWTFYFEVTCHITYKAMDLIDNFLLITKIIGPWFCKRLTCWHLTLEAVSGVNKLWAVYSALKTFLHLNVTVNFDTFIISFCSTGIWFTLGPDGHLLFNLALKRHCGDYSLTVRNLFGLGCSDSTCHAMTIWIPFPSDRCRQYLLILYTLTLQVLPYHEIVCV